MPQELGAGASLGHGVCWHRTEGTLAAAEWPLGHLRLLKNGEESAGLTTSPPALPARSPCWCRGAGLVRAGVAGGRGTLALHGICFPLAHQGQSGPGRAQRGPWEGAAVTSQQKEPGSGQETVPGAKCRGRTLSRAPRTGRLRPQRAGGRRRPQPPVPPLGARASTDGGFLPPSREQSPPPTAPPPHSTQGLTFQRAEPSENSILMLDRKSVV